MSRILTSRLLRTGSKSSLCQASFRKFGLKCHINYEIGAIFDCAKVTLFVVP